MMSQEFLFVLSIIIIVGFFSTIKMIIRHRLGIPQRSGREGRRDQALAGPKQDGDTHLLRDEVRMLKDRIQTLERIAVDKENSLSREIEQLRDR